MNIWLIVVAALVGLALGYLVSSVRAARRAQQLHGELEAARARLSSEADLRARTAELLAHSEAQVRAAVESASRLALDANSETFLKLAREVFGRDQAAASATLKEREVAIAQLVEPIKAALAKQEEQSQALERERRESVGKLSGQLESLVNVQALLQRETRNLSTALRQPWFTPVTGPVFWLPLALLGYPPYMILTAEALSLIYQFWIHTEVVRRLPAPLEWLLNTPSHHRVHHGKNIAYLDRNHGGVLILWDRLLGTFAPEDEREPVRYGITHDLTTFNPLKIALHEFVSVARDAWCAGSLKASLGYIFAPPGWTPAVAAASVTTEPEAVAV